MFMRLATMEEVDACYQCIEDARAYHEAHGFEQWHPTYPTRNTIIEDVKDQIGYVLCDENGLMGYCSIVIGVDPAYVVIDGEWATDRDYAAIRRMAFNERSRGKRHSEEAFFLFKKFCVDHGAFAIRVDTHEMNKIMRHIFVREGFKYCGIIQFDGGPKCAYEWDF